MIQKQEKLLKKTLQVLLKEINLKQIELNSLMDKENKRFEM